jgi:adenylate kinase family enzyme
MATETLPVHPSVSTTLTNSLDHAAVICITGANCDGKTTCRGFLHKLLDPNQQKDPAKMAVVQADASDIVRWGLQLTGELGDQVRACKDMMAKGDYIPDRIMLPLFLFWLEHEVVPKHPRMKLLILSGFPRTDEQVQLIMQLFKHRSIIHMISDQKVLEKMFLKRLAEDMEKEPHLRRVETAGGITVFHNRMHNYETQTVPGLAKYTWITPIYRADPMVTRLKMILDCLYTPQKHVGVSKNVNLSALTSARPVRRAHGVLGNKSDPIHEEIALIETGEPRAKAAHLPLPDPNPERGQRSELFPHQQPTGSGPVKFVHIRG